MNQFQPLAADDPRRLGEYEIVARLGEGGQGVVYLGKAGSGEQAAVKLLHHALVADPEARSRFLREVAVAQRVARFCTAPVLHADLEGSRPYIVSEYVPGPSLRELVINEGPRRGAALERLAISTATALAAIHRAGILHRDFKPANVLMGPEGPVVIDFGIARALDSPGATATGMAMGTPSYLAPEQLTGTSPVSEAADVFAWGVTMVYAATGTPAFGSDSIPVVMNRILHEEPQIGGIDGTLGELVAACLSKDPAQRPTADQLIVRLTGQPAPNAAIEPLTGPTARLPQPPPPTAPQPDAPAGPAGTPAQARPPHAATPHPGNPGAPRSGPAPQLGNPGAQGGWTPQAAAWKAGDGPVPETGPYGRPSPDGNPPHGQSGAPPHGHGGTHQGHGNNQGMPSGAQHGPTSRPPMPHGTPGPGAPGAGGAGGKGGQAGQRRTLTFALSGAAAAALLVVAGAVVVQANAKPQTVVAVGNSSATTPTADAEIPPEVMDPPTVLPSTVPELDIDEPKPTRTKPKQGDDGLARVPDPITQPTRPPATRRPQPTPTPTVTKTKTSKPVDRVEPDPEPTAPATTDVSQQPTSVGTKKPTPKPTAKPKPTLKANPYTPARVCGSGYKVINSHALGAKARIYLLYSSGAGRNCVVTMSRLVYPGKVRMNAVLQVKGGSTGSNLGRFTAYAGPVRLPAKGKCVIWGGSWGSLSWKSGWSHCG